MKRVSGRAKVRCPSAAQSLILRHTCWISSIGSCLLEFRVNFILVVQAWRAKDWWPDHYSIAIYDLAKVRGGTQLKFTQIGIPPHRYSGHYRGWIEAYWTPAHATCYGKQRYPQLPFDGHCGTFDIPKCADLPTLPPTVHWLADGPL